MAHHTPDLRPPGERMQRWIEEVSDLGLSIYMLLAALGVAVILFVFQGSVPF